MKQIKTHSMMGLILLGLTFHLPSTIVAQNSNPEINDMTTFYRVKELRRGVIRA